MAMPVKISDDLLERAKTEARDTHRSATAQIEHWATLGRAVETMLAYGEILALKRVGERMPLPRNVPREVVESRLATLVTNPNRRDVASRIRAAGGPFYGADPANPGKVIEIAADGSRRWGTLRDRKFFPSKSRSGARGA